MKFFASLFLALLFLLTSCKEKNQPTQLKNSIYRGTIEAQDNEVIPFLFKVTSPTTLEIYNAEEVIFVDEIRYENDSVYIQIPVFQIALVAKINERNELNGYYIKTGSSSGVPFFASEESFRFPRGSEAQVNVSGKWEVVFSPDREDGGSIAMGLFEQTGNKVTGTFRTTTGDYRYLEGVMHGYQMKLSTFDGAHAFLFTATITGDQMSGTFYSRNTYKVGFTAKRNKIFELPDANKLTHLKKGYEQLEFSFPDVNGKPLSLEDEYFKNKVVVVQVMGTWCPNCLDEARFLSEYYMANKDKPLAFVALSFETAKTSEKAWSAINRFVDNVGLEYPVLLANYGSAKKAYVLEKLPALEQFISYPTAIFIDKQGKVRKIHTGFNGPATGEKYIEFQQEFDQFVTLLTNE